MCQILEVNAAKVVQVESDTLSVRSPSYNTQRGILRSNANYFLWQTATTYGVVAIFYSTGFISACFGTLIVGSIFQVVSLGMAIAAVSSSTGISTTNIKRDNPDWKKDVRYYLVH